MTRSQTTAAKRQRQEQKRAKARTKEERREARHAPAPEGATAATPVAVQESQLMEELAALHQGLESGEVPLNEFEERREQIRTQLELLQ